MDTDTLHFHVDNRPSSNQLVIGLTSHTAVPVMMIVPLGILMLICLMIPLQEKALIPLHPRSAG